MRGVTIDAMSCCVKLPATALVVLASFAALFWKRNPLNDCYQRTLHDIIKTHLEGVGRAEDACPSVRGVHTESSDAFAGVLAARGVSATPVGKFVEV